MKLTDGTPTGLKPRGRLTTNFDDGFFEHFVHIKEYELIFFQKFRLSKER